MIYDYIILGGGPGGAVAAKCLAEKNSNTLLIEAGKSAPPTIRPEETNRYSILNHYKNAGVNPIFSKKMFNLGEGVGLGGGALVNGGLIWRTPGFILKEWDEKYIIDSSFNRLNDYFDEIEKMLNVKVEVAPPANFDLDSVLLDTAAKDLKLKSVLVPKAVDGCTKNNKCPSLCPNNAKTHISSYLESFKKLGGKILTEDKVNRIYKTGDIWKIDTDKESFSSKKIVMAMGATGSPHFLMKNKIIPKSQKIHFQCHANLKCIATFGEKIKASQGTMFTHQVQEYEKEGIYLMPSNFSSPYLSTITADFDQGLKKEIQESFDSSSIFIAQVRPKGIGRVHNILGQRILTYHFLEEDFFKMKQALVYLCQILFHAGAIHIYLPIGFGMKFSSIEEVKNLEIEDIKKFDILSVHTMASLPMRNKNSGGLVDEKGRLIFDPSIIVSDASVLPSNLGESPQGTIMAFAHSIFNQSIESPNIAL